jgi:hypothetical protein
VILEADPEQIVALDSKELVRLMKLLLLAESRLAEIPLRGSHVPLQITVADGGEDGRVEWSDGVDSTTFFPRRFCIFQAKATNLTDASVRSEVLKESAAAQNKAVQPKSNTKKKAKAGAKKSRRPNLVLSRAISDALGKRGAYAILSTSAFTGEKRDKLKKAIFQAVRDGGGDPARIEVDVLDANKIAEWVNCHPAVALWLAKHTRRRSLAGFQSHEGWGKSADIRVSPWIEGTIPRFFAVNVAMEESGPAKPEGTVWTFEEAAKAVLERLEKHQQSVRLTGPSGFGKSRFAYEIFNRRASLADEVDTATMIYADYSIVGDEVAKLALEIAESGSSSILVVDECPDEIHRKISGIAQRADSSLRVLTIDVETKIVSAEKTLTIQLEQASKDVISGIAKGIDPQIDDTSLGLIQELAQGFPQMAVLAAQQKGSGKQTIQSAEQYIDRVLWGYRSPNADAQKALSILSLFDWVGLGGRVSVQAAYIAEHLAHMDFDTFVEHVKSFRHRGVIVLRGDFVQVQPVPLAARLAAGRLSLFPDGKLFSFFKDAPGELKASLLKRIRWLDMVPEAKVFAAALLAPGALGNLEVLNSENGSEALDRLVHVDPELAMSTIDRVFTAFSVDDFAQVKQGRRHLVWALEKLVFRRSTFERAARLLRRLGAVEVEERISNNAAGQFKGLYHLYLSGTEAEPEIRLRVLDEGLASSSIKERELCVDALNNMLESGHFTRGGGSEDIGSAAPLKDWQPKTYGDTWDFFRSAISRLLKIALSDDPLASKAKTILGRRIRGLLNQLAPKEIKGWVDAIVQKYGFWQEAAQEINEWLYFDGDEAAPEIKAEVRQYFDSLLPSDPVELAVMYCHGWHIDFHDPDSTYQEGERSGHSYDYPVRRSLDLANQISVDPATIERAVRALATSDAKSAAPFARRLAELVSDPLTLFKMALKEAETPNAIPNLQFFGGIISGADARDPKIARECVRAALGSSKLKPNAISMVGSGKLQPDDLKLVASLLQAGDVKPWECASLSYGRGLDHLSPSEFMPLLEELMRHGASGVWSALDIIFMYLHPNKVPDLLLQKKLKEILVSPELFDGFVRHAMDGYHLEQTVALLAKYKMLNRRYAQSLVRRMLALVDIEESDIFMELDDPVSKVLRTLMPLFPDEMWAGIAPRLLAKRSVAQFRMERLIKTSSDDNLGPGPLYDLPAGTYLEWVRKDGSKRAGMVARWLPIATKNESGALVWHPAIESFVPEFGGHPSVLNEIARRMHPTTWWGSVVPFLEPWLPLLDLWLNHPIPEVRVWAQQQIEHLNQAIDTERKRDEEDEVRFG